MKNDTESKKLLLIVDREQAYYANNKFLLSQLDAMKYEANFDIEYTHHSTAIEGNTLSLRDTALLIEDDILPANKSTREMYEVRNHAEAIKYVRNQIQIGNELNQDIVKELHALLTKDIFTGGIYRDHNVYIRGARHVPPAPLKMFTQLKYFYADMQFKRESMHPIEYAAWTHGEFVKIHPFPDGNGRVSRLIMNYELLRFGYRFLNIKKEDRRRYFEALDEYHCEGDLSEFTKLVAELEIAELRRFNTMLRQIEQAHKSALTAPSIDSSSLKERLEARQAIIDVEKRRNASAPPRKSTDRDR
jgi:Fic family protein